MDNRSTNDAGCYTTWELTDPLTIYCTTHVTSYSYENIVSGYFSLQHKYVLLPRALHII